MEWALLAARLVLFGVFVVAGAAKLADRDGSARALVEFGLPQALARLGGVVLPWTELLVGLSLLLATTAWYGAVAALLLLLVFNVAIGLNLARGRTPDCHCFGQLHSAPAGWPTLARNVALAAIASFVVWSGHRDSGPSAIAWIGDLPLAERLVAFGAAAALALMAGQTALLLQILRQQGRVLLRLDELESGATAPSPKSEQPAHGLPLGVAAPGFELESPRGQRVALADLLAPGKPVLLVFTNPSCGPCTAMMPEVVRWQREHAASFTLALISEGSVEDNAAKAELFDIGMMLVQDGREVAESYQAYGTPAAVLVGGDGMIASSLVFGVDAIRTLVGRTLGLLPPASQPVRPQTAGPARSGNGLAATPSVPALTLGQSVPLMKLIDLDGGPVHLPQLRGEPTVLLFWNNNCGFCRAMLDDLRAWDADKPPETPRLVVISSGDVEANRALNLGASVWLDNGQQVARRFGANGTPMAVLLDEDAKLASPVVAGAKAVMDLARGSSPATNGFAGSAQAVAQHA